MGEWLIGVYKGRLITASGTEKKDIWENIQKIRTLGFFPTEYVRTMLIPYFFLLLPIDETITPTGRRNTWVVNGDPQILGKYCLNSPAYMYGGLKIPAYGHMDTGWFVLDEKADDDLKQQLDNKTIERVCGVNPCFDTVS